MIKNKRGKSFLKLALIASSFTIVATAISCSTPSNPSRPTPIDINAAAILIKAETSYKIQESIIGKSPSVLKSELDTQEKLRNAFGLNELVLGTYNLTLAIKDPDDVEGKLKLSVRVANATNVDTASKDFELSGFLKFTRIDLDAIVNNITTTVEAARASISKKITSEQFKNLVSDIFKFEQYFKASTNIDNVTFENYEVTTEAQKATIKFDIKQTNVPSNKKSLSFEFANFSEVNQDELATTIYNALNNQTLDMETSITREAFKNSIIIEENQIKLNDAWSDNFKAKISEFNNSLKSVKDLSFSFKDEENDNLTFSLTYNFNDADYSAILKLNNFRTEAEQKEITHKWKLENDSDYKAFYDVLNSIKTADWNLNSIWNKQKYLSYFETLNPNGSIKFLNTEKLEIFAKFVISEESKSILKNPFIKNVTLTNDKDILRAEFFVISENGLNEKVNVILNFGGSSPAPELSQTATEIIAFFDTFESKFITFDIQLRSNNELEVKSFYDRIKTLEGDVLLNALKEESGEAGKGRIDQILADKTERELELELTDNNLKLYLTLKLNGLSRKYIFTVTGFGEGLNDPNQVQTNFSLWKLKLEVFLLRNLHLKQGTVISDFYQDLLAKSSTERLDIIKGLINDQSTKDLFDKYDLKVTTISYNASDKLTWNMLKVNLEFNNIITNKKETLTLTLESDYNDVVVYNVIQTRVNFFTNKTYTIAKDVSSYIFKQEIDNRYTNGTYIIDAIAMYLNPRDQVEFRSLAQSPFTKFEFEIDAKDKTTINMTVTAQLDKIIKTFTIKITGFKI
ncbi:hypothetical protein ACA758_01105 [Mycoplasmopsis agassizii]|uniref:hypothetical protein n=1 Tax=Mycoplasmopsis agassizii TaxID=33922 RepID=UPI003528BF09